MFFKIFNTQSVSKDWDLAEQKFDWIQEMKGVPQDAVWHAEGDVYTHTRMVINALHNLPEFQQLSEQDQCILNAAAMLHDVEKRSTTGIEIIDGKERIVSPRHAKKGELTARSILYKDIPTPFSIREQVCKLVRHHGLPLWAIEKNEPRKSVIEVSLYLNTEHLAILAKADILGRICEDAEEMLYRIELFKALCQEYNCYGKPFSFKSDYGRYLFLNREDISPDYEPFDDLKFEVYMMSALPGSGKDTYIKKNLKLPVLSLDDLRREHKVSPTDEKKNGQIIQLAKETAKEYMRARQSFVFNATNITADMRGKWASLFAEYGGRIKIVYIEVPYRKLLSQNKNREYPVPEKALESMLSKWEIPGFNEAHEVVFC